MTDAEKEEASRKVHQWARFFDGQAQEPTTAALHDLRLIAHYARHVEEDRGRWMMEAEAYAAGVFKTARDEALEKCWWYKLGKFFRLLP